MSVRKDIPEWKKYFWMQKVSIPNYPFNNPFFMFPNLSFSMRYHFFQNLYIWVNGHFRMEKISLHAKNQHLTFKIIRFRTLSYCFLIWAFWWGINFFLFFQKLYIWVNGHSRMEKISLNVKNQHPNFKFIRFRTIFLIPQGSNFDFKMRKRKNVDKIHKTRVRN